MHVRLSDANKGCLLSYLYLTYLSNYFYLVAPKYLCDHIRPPISASSLHRLHSFQRRDISMPVSEQPWPILGPLLLLVRHSGITSLLLFARLFSLLPSHRLSRFKSDLFPLTEMH